MPLLCTESLFELISFGCRKASKSNVPDIVWQAITTCIHATSGRNVTRRTFVSHLCGPTPHVLPSTYSVFTVQEYGNGKANANMTSAGFASFIDSILRRCLFSLP
jgi:hypothetical protein